MNRKGYKDLLQDDLDFKTTETMQIVYSRKLSEINHEEVFLRERDFKLVAGVDVHYYKKKREEWGVACAVFWNVDEKRAIETSFAEMKINFPYKPGFLGFREAKIISQAIHNSRLKPDLLMCDGHGIIHPRSFGEAVHLGLALDLPSFGVAKNPYIGFSTWQILDRIKGARTPIWLKNPNSPNSSNMIIGYAICLAHSKKPVFISTGTRISLNVAIAIAQSTTIHHRQPDPLFLADKNARTFKGE